MFSFDIDCWQDEKDLLIADLYELGSVGISEFEDFVRAFFEDDADIAALRARFPNAREAPADNRDWVAYSQGQLTPRHVGRRFFLVPEWREDPAPEGRIRIVINPGRAFGTGHHESTRLCLELLEDNLRPDDAVADVGTGSGILAEAACRLGAREVVACDNDPESVEVSRENLERGGIHLHVFTGSAADLAPGHFDLILANISPEILAVIAPDLRRALKFPDGRAILSGIEEPDLEFLVPALAKAGFRVIETREEANWRALLVTAALPTQSNSI